MKNLRPRPYALLFSLLLVLSACGDDDPAGPDGSGGPLGPGSPGGPLTGENSMRATINGNDWASTFAIGTETISVGTVAAVSGSSGGTTVAFAFFVREGVSTYTIGENGTNAIVTMGTTTWTAPGDGTAANPNGTGGSITITSLTEEGVTGTFAFIVKNRDSDDLAEVTDGAFNVRFQQVTRERVEASALRQAVEAVGERDPATPVLDR